MKLKENLDLSKQLQKHAVLSIVLSALLIIVGILLIIMPLVSTAVIVWILIALIGVAGLAAVIHFIYPGKNGKRNAVAFVLGLLVIALVVLIAVDAGTHNSVIVEGQTVSGFAFVTGKIVLFISVFYGIFAVLVSLTQIFAIGSVEKGKKAWVIVGSIISIIVGVLMVIFPFLMATVGAIIAGVYLIIVSITAIVFASKFVGGPKEPKEVKAKPEEEE